MGVDDDSLVPIERITKYDIRRFPANPTQSG